MAKKIKSKYTKKQIAMMHRIYRQTNSLAVTAKACDCSVNTVKKYRDEQRWISDIEVKNSQSELSRDTTLTPDIAMKLAAGWRVQVQDKDLCPIVNITVSQLKNWLLRNQQVNVVWKVKQGDKEIVRKELIGLRDLREREWANFEYTLLQEQRNLMRLAEAAGDYRTAASIGQWLLTKRLPKKFGDRAETEITQQIQVNQITVAELDQDTRKKILEQLRKKQVESNVIESRK